MLLTVNLLTYFLVVCIGGGVVMNIWSRIFPGNFRIISKVCLRKDRGEGGQPNVDRGRGVENHLKCADILY